MTSGMQFDLLVELYSEGPVDTELLPCVNPQQLRFTAEGDLKVTALVNYLKDLGYALDEHGVHFYSRQARTYVFCGNDPIPDAVVVPKNELAHSTVKIAFTPPITNKFGTVLTPGNKFVELQNDSDAIVTKSNARRTKERKIGHIIEKVCQWRRLYTGFKGGEAKQEPLTLDAAASQIGIAKKSLDDYMLQLKFGRKLGFNFQEHKDEKVGLLRKYNRKLKDIYNFREQHGKDVPLPPNLVEIAKAAATSSCKSPYCCCPM